MITVEQAHKMGAKGGAVDPHERLLFEAWMAGHCWKVIGEWDGKTYVHADEKGTCWVHPGAMNTRQLWAAWRDRAALQPAFTEGVHTLADGHRYVVARVSEKGEDEFA
jgi:hypothetical protein